ncbi:MAG: NTP transferase domain-containing protein [Candidatus Sungbacteria bacterium]|nr:NTP transferase domain-containing protein [Candidatus Sungbacteria bacterium]
MKIRVIILAAGKGTRMNNGFPKALTPVGGMPMIMHLLRAVADAHIDPRPLIVIGHEAEKVREALGSRYDYAMQDEQLGTGHAVACARSAVGKDIKAVMVLYADHPTLRSPTITRLVRLHRESAGPLALMTVTVPDFNEWRAPLYDFGRIIRDERDEHIMDIVEKRDATPEQLNIREVNPSFFCFRAAWLWDHLPQLKQDNTAHEFYLTDLVRIAIQNGESVAFIGINPLESIGVNTPEQLALAERLLEHSDESDKQ